MGLRARAWLVVAGGVGCGAGLLGLLWWRRQRLRSRQRSGYDALVGGTPMVELRQLSRLLKRRILCKAEFMNPGGTAKDRIAQSMLDAAEACGALREGGTVVEGTSGSTGIALAAQCRARGYRCVIVMPDDQADEKRRLLEQFGAEVKVVRTAGIANPHNYVREAMRLAGDLPGAVFMDQFESAANFDAHLRTSGPEIWRQARRLAGRLDAFVMGAGTGGMISGVGAYLASQRCAAKVVLADPPGSSLFARVKHGVAFAAEQRERGIRLHRYDTIAEGIGLDRLTRNFRRGERLVRGAVRVRDQEALWMAHWILAAEGLFVGSSSAVNLVAAARTAVSLPEGSVVATVLCDSGQRHVSRFWNRDFIGKWGGGALRWPTEEEANAFVKGVAAGERDEGDVHLPWAE